MVEMGNSGHKNLNEATSQILGLVALIGPRFSGKAGIVDDLQVQDKWSEISERFPEYNSAVFAVRDVLDKSIRFPQARRILEVTWYLSRDDNFPEVVGRMIGNPLAFSVLANRMGLLDVVSSGTIPSPEKTAKDFYRESNSMIRELGIIFRGVGDEITTEMIVESTLTGKLRLTSEEKPQ